MVVALYCFALINPAAAACEARFERVSEPRFSAAGYNIFAEQPLRGEARLVVERVAADLCQVIVTLFSGGIGGRQLTSAWGALNYQIFEDSSRPRLLANVQAPQSSGVLTAVLRGETRELTLDMLLKIPAGQTVHAGTYSDIVTASLYDAKTLRLLDQATISLTVPVPARAEVTVSASSTHPSFAKTYATLDLGTLETGETGTAYIFVRSTSDYTVSLASENGGKLRRQRGGWMISYALTVDGAPVRLTSTPQRVLTAPGPTNGDAHELEVTVGDVSRKRAGRYTDLLRIMVSVVE